MNDLVSIVLPVYNGDKYLKESINSVVSQTYENWELLILDDCSTDLTPIISKEYVKQDSRIKYFRNDRNLRLPKNLNKGFSLAKGKYFTWTSDDNLFKPNAIEEMVSVLNKNKNVGFVFASCRIIDEVGKEVEYISVNDSIIEAIVGENVVGACFMYTREVYNEIGNYDPKLTLVEDFDYWQRIFSKFEVKAISKILYKYRWHDGALTSTMNKKLFYENLEKMLVKNIKLFSKINFRQKYYYYNAMNNCEMNLNRKVFKIKFKYNYYKILFFVFHRLPLKIKRTIQKID